ncbi:hypothetical protein ZWY2020_051738 [Hordeum vulgare]|nr:hypothetical protein ZWY2020_051738 [Hordeum vulgare]
MNNSYTKHFMVIHSATHLQEYHPLIYSICSLVMMTKYMRNNMQGLVLLSLLVVVCLTCPGGTYGEIINDKRSKMMRKVSHVTRPPCYKDGHQLPGREFCCEIDNLCWPNLGECFINCPCKINCTPAATTTQ